MSEEDTSMEPASKRQRIEEDSNNSLSRIDNCFDIVLPTEPLKEASETDYTEFVTPEELEKLREFKVLDEVKSNDEDTNNEESDSDDDGKSEELAEDEIEKMLDEDLPEGFKGAPKPKEKPYVTRKKIVLEEKGVNHFEVLPLDWIMVRHFSGMPIYMHRTTRVCTLSKPYFLGEGNTRRHEIPISAIPCLAYRKALEEEEKQKEIDRKIEEQIKNGTWQTNTVNATSQKDKDKESQNDGHNTTNNKNDQANDSVQAISSQENKHQASNNNTETSNSDEALATEINKYRATIKEEPVDSPKCPFRNGELSSLNNKPDSENTQEATTSNNAGPACDDDGIPLNRKPIVLPGGIVMPPPRVETVNTSWKTQHLSAEQVNDYCKRLFKFKTISIMHFMCWADRRKYRKARKTLQYPTLPAGTKLITIPAAPAAPGQDNSGRAGRRDWVMNMNGRSYLSEFHEYVCRALQKQPVYEFKQLENAATPYQATVYIGGMAYGVGLGSSKRQAKANAARASIQILIPEMKDEQPPSGTKPAASTEPDFTFFDYVGIEDPRITEFCAATCEPSPHAILRTCLLRNFGAGDRHIHTEMKKEFQKIELTMKVGKHTATVVCKNKKTAKQRASQAILQALHPHVRSWGSLLRLYGSRSVKSCKERKLEEQQITLLQDRARPYEPNHAVLAKLRHEMRKLRERDAAVVPIGTLLLPAGQLPPRAAGLQHVDL